MIAEVSLEQFTPENVTRGGVVRLTVGRKLSPEEFLAVASRLGAPEPFGLPKYRPDGFPPEVTLIDTHGDGVTAAPRGFGEGWHQDSTFLSAPPEYTVLHALDVPVSGGDTSFADTRPALLSLPAEERVALRGLDLEHSVLGTYRITPKDAGKTLGELSRGLPRTRHPAVFPHPRGGETLLLSPLYTSAELSAEIRPLFDRALEEVVRGAVVHRWTSGEILAWDNRVVLHAASAYRGEERRRLIRTVVRDAARGAS